jgi:toluene monooxygenase electron transfer component
MFTIRVADSDTAFSCAATDTIARAGLRADLPMPYECNTGSCGTCKVELVSGAIDSLRSDAPGLADRDRAKHRILACQARPTTDCVIKVRLDHTRPWVPRPERVRGSLVATRDVTHDIREFSFDCSAVRPFLPGQYAMIHLPGVDAPRAYSMSNIAGGPTWQFQIKRVPGGRATTVLFDRLTLGSTVEIDGPYGHAYLRPDAPRDLVCIAGGSGIAPAVSIARGIAESASLAGRHLYFFYGGRGPADICGEDVLRALPALLGRYTYVPVISGPLDDRPLDVAWGRSDGCDPAAWSGSTGFVHEAVADTLGATLPAYEFYFAGPPAMTLAVQQLLIEAKVPRMQMHFDQFF